MSLIESFGPSQFADLPAQSGFSDVPRSLPAPIDAVADLRRRLATLTPAQRRMLNHIQKGQSNKQIAYELNISETTVKAHVSALLIKLGASSRTQIVVKLGRLGLLPVSSQPTGDHCGTQAQSSADLLTAGMTLLTRRQRRVLQMICEGKLNKQIAGELNVGETTVKAHVTAVLRRLGLHSRTQVAAAMWAASCAR
jgi:DNA-binding NarL/FixJ family response regulator